MGRKRKEVAVGDAGCVQVVIVEDDLSAIKDRRDCLPLWRAAKAAGDVERLAAIRARMEQLEDA